MPGIRMPLSSILLLVALGAAPAAAGAADSDAALDEREYRRPSGETELRYWLENMVAYHGFTIDEVRQATGMPPAEIESALKRFDITRGIAGDRKPGQPLLVLPYPGGRHPRIGFLDGAVRPQRDTKVSVFLPWRGAGYVVADLPEAIWSNLGLTYLAHTHVPTLWTKQNVELEKLEWKRAEGGVLEFDRTLPNGIRFGTKVTPQSSEVRMEMWLTNGTPEVLSDLRVQNCVMLKGAPGFEEQTADNKVFNPPYAACRARDGRHWVITGWVPNHRAWSNAPCPCLHSDPKFPDCAPGQTQRLRGWLSFFEGTDIAAELRRIDATGWRNSD
jgi:hypothetical protein